MAATRLYEALLRERIFRCPRELAARRCLEFGDHTTEEMNPPLSRLLCDIGVGLSAKP